MEASLKAVLNEAEHLMVSETEPAELAGLGEDEAIALEGRVRRARAKAVSQYRRSASTRVTERGGRGRARPENSRARARAEAFERALSRVSRRVAVLAQESAAALRAERLAVAARGQTGRLAGCGPGGTAPGAPGTGGHPGADRGTRAALTSAGTAAGSGPGGHRPLADQAGPERLAGRRLALASDGPVRRPGPRRSRRRPARAAGGRPAGAPEARKMAAPPLKPPSASAASTTAAAVQAGALVREVRLVGELPAGPVGAVVVPVLPTAASSSAARSRWPHGVEGEHQLAGLGAGHPRLVADAADAEAGHHERVPAGGQPLRGGARRAPRRRAPGSTSPSRSGSCPRTPRGWQASAWPSWSAASSQSGCGSAGQRRPARSRSAGPCRMLAQPVSRAKSPGRRQRPAPSRSRPGRLQAEHPVDGRPDAGHIRSANAASPVTRHSCQTPTAT